MKNILIINGHQYYPFAEGKLNQALIDKATTLLGEEDFEFKTTATEKAYDVDEEVEKFQWAHIVLLQTPLNWQRWGLPAPARRELFVPFGVPNHLQSEITVKSP